MTNDNISKVKVSIGDKIDIKPWWTIDLTRLGSRHAEGRYMDKKSKPGIKKLNQDEYCVLSSGEVCQFEKNDHKMPTNLRATFHELANLIRHNFDSDQNQHNALFITLTYVDNMTDPAQLMTDFDRFMKRLQRNKKNHKLDYIAVMEPQGRGAWHVHLMLKSDQPVLYIDNRSLAIMACDLKSRKTICVGGLWGHGMTEVKRLKSDDVGAYYIAYFTSLEAEAVDIDSEAAQYSTDMDGKRYKKGARLKLYPKYMKFYRRSRGIATPVTEKAIFSEVTKEFGQPTISKTYNLVQDEEVKKSIQTMNFKKSKKTP